MDLLGTHALKVEFRTGRQLPNLLRPMIYAELMNETAMNFAPLRPKTRQKHPTNIPVEVYTCGEAPAITEVTVRRDLRGRRKRGGKVAGRLSVMKAIVISRLGGPEVLEVRDMPDPVPSAGQELVRVQAGGLNFADVMTTQGGYPGTPKPPLVAGREFCGVRESDGQRVMGYTQWAAFAERAAARSERCGQSRKTGRTKRERLSR
jgi:hypothetical protein